MSKLPRRGLLRLLCVNDIYTTKPQHGLGGWAELATVLKRYRSLKDPSLFFVNGDFLAGSSLAEVVRGKHAIEIMNYLQVDVAGVGNHEFDFGSEVLQERISESKFRWFGANVLEKASGKVLPGVLTSSVYEIDIPLDDGSTRKFKLGVFGVCTPATPYLSFPGDKVLFGDVISHSKRAVEELKEAGAEFIVCSSHVHMEEDHRIAKEIKEIDVILGGHDHIPMATMEGNTLIMKCGQNSYWLGVVELNLLFNDNEHGGMTDSQSKTLHVIPSWRMEAIAGIEGDSDCKSIIEKYMHIYEEEQRKKAMAECGGDIKILDEVLAIMSGELDTRSGTVRKREGSGGNLVADAMLFYNKGADIAIINGGDLRADKVYPPGYKFTRKDILAELPYDSPVVTIRIKGSDLIEGLEQMLTLSKGSGSFPHLSVGCKLRYQAKGAKFVVSEFQITGSTVTQEKYYLLAITEYLAQGGDGITAFERGIRSPHKGLGPPTKTANCVIEYLKKRPTKQYEPQEEGRVLLILPNNLDGQVHSFV
eukprot:TRINITY_DN861_c0_g5_i1.p1 TRINITY_DN861_c0_g5~~TRINITY_DN861_c0_g5_i1.p1  ORF type:complete len:533 (-),score=108.54 TRINITY_DN861_c0_g5_i1:48-1646(-)